MDWTAWIHERRLELYEAQLRNAIDDFEDLKFMDQDIARSIAESIGMKELPKRRLVEWAEQQGEPQIEIVTTSLSDWLASCGAAEKEASFSDMADVVDDLRELNDNDLKRILQDVKPLRFRRVLAHLTALKGQSALSRPLVTLPPVQRQHDEQIPPPPPTRDYVPSVLAEKDESPPTPPIRDYVPPVVAEKDDSSPTPPMRDYVPSTVAEIDQSPPTPPMRDYVPPVVATKDEPPPPPPPSRDYMLTASAEKDETPPTPPMRDYVPSTITEIDEPPPPPPPSRDYTPPLPAEKDETPPPTPPTRDYVPSTLGGIIETPPSPPTRDYVSSIGIDNVEAPPPPPPNRDYMPSITEHIDDSPPTPPTRDYVSSLVVDHDDAPPPPPPMRDYAPTMSVISEEETKSSVNLATIEETPLTPGLEEYRNLLAFVVFAEGSPKFANLMMLREFERDFQISEADAEAEINRQGWSRQELLQVEDYCRFLSNLGKDDGSEFRARALSKFEADNEVTEEVRQHALTALDWSNADLVSAWIGERPTLSEEEPVARAKSSEAARPEERVSSSLVASSMSSADIMSSSTQPRESSSDVIQMSEESAPQQADQEEDAERHPSPRPPQRMGSSVYTQQTQRSLVRRFEAGAVTAAIETSRKRRLGRGTVYAARLPEVGDVAVKWLRVGEGDDDENTATRVDEANFFREVQTLAKLSDPNVIQLLGFAHGAGVDRFVVYELCAGGSVESRFSGVLPLTLSWGERLLIALDAARGLFYLHSHGECRYVHGDITPANILLSAPCVLPAKLAEFGLAREVDRTLTHVISPGGTEGYICPERERNGKLAPSSDMYAMGVTLLNLVTGRPTAIESQRTPAGLIAWTRQVIANGGGLEAACEALADSSVCANKTSGENYQLVVRGLLALAFKCLDDDPSRRLNAGQLQEDLDRLASSLNGEDALLYNAHCDDFTALPVLTSIPRRLSQSAVAPASPGRDGGTLRVLVASFNLGFGAVTQDDLDLWLRGGRVPGSVSGATPKAEKFADMVVVGTQECFSKANPREFSNLVTAIQAHLLNVSPCKYEYVDSASSGHTRLGMRLMIFIRSDRLRVESVAKDALTAGGLFKLFKGALSAFVVVSDAAGRRSAYVFANCHLPSGEGRIDDRNAAVLRVKQRLTDLSPDGAATMFIFGDLNYRSNPALNLALAPLSAASVVDLAANRDLNALYSLDELRQQLDLGGCLEGFQSPQPTFLPTSRLERRPGFHYSLARLPSYTDRVVFASTSDALVDRSGHTKMRVNCLDYDAVGQVAISDHKPLRAAFALSPILDSFGEDSFDENDATFSKEDRTSNFRATTDCTLSRMSSSLSYRRRFARIRDLVGTWANIGIYNAVARARSHQQLQEPPVHV